MPIKIPAGLPAHDVLSAMRGSWCISEEAAIRQDIRPLQIGLVNLMPNKARTETQFARLVGATPLQVELTPDPHDRPCVEEHRAGASGGLSTSPLRMW